MMKGLGYIRQCMEGLAILYIRLAIMTITSVVFNNGVLFSSCTKLVTMG